MATEGSPPDETAPGRRLGDGDWGTVGPFDDAESHHEPESYGEARTVGDPSGPTTPEDAHHPAEESPPPPRTKRTADREPWPTTWPTAPRFQATAHFKDPYEIKPQRYTPAQVEIPPSVPLDPILPYIAPPIPRRRRSDWPVLAVALVVSALIMAGCCIAGFAMYAGYGSSLLP